jgi:hypothetical protein
VIKAGLMGVVVSFIYITGLTLISPFCTLCFTPLLGLGVGYLAGWFDTPAQINTSLGRGFIAGAITGVGAIVGQIMAGVINSILVTRLEQLPELMHQVGLEGLVITDATEYWQTTLAGNALCSLLNVGLIVVLGAMGGLLWWQRHRPQTLNPTG